MNIVILAGGTGSIALQTGLYNLLDAHLDGIDTKILVNGYDNGLSTGAVRQVMNGRILGPSDIRKNQTTRLALEHPDSPWIKFLNIRFTIPSSDVKNFCLMRIAELENALQNKKHDTFRAAQNDSFEHADDSAFKANILREAIEEYFRSPIATKIDYNDFSLANIIYAGLAKVNGYSLRSAARIMASLMGIKDNVILNDDTSLFLGAITKSGKRITDEGDIVSWGNHDDPFVDIFFTDAEGNNAVPVLCNEAREALLNADLIILSSGTQWSSLIPTYASVGFKEVMYDGVKGDVLMVMNRRPDKDSPGQGASEIIDILVPRYFKEGQLNVILDESADDIMKIIDEKAKAKITSAEWFKMSAPGEQRDTKTHDSRRLAMAVGYTYFKDFVNSDYFVFDYDDTLVGRGNIYPLSSKSNVQAICELNTTKKIAICTGNSIKAIKIHNSNYYGLSTYKTSFTPLAVYADGGVNKYLYDTRFPDGSDDGISHKFIECIDKSVLLEKDGAYGINSIISSLKEHHIPLSKIENRGDVMITIKPIDEEYRPMIIELIKLLIQDTGLVVKASGRTTIEIHHPSLSKAAAIQYIKNTEKPSTITYVGDEFYGGNDECVKSIPGIRCLHVTNPAKTAFFILTLTGYRPI